MAYVIGSDKGKKIAEELGVNATYEASDGSIWTKQSDGSVTVKTSKGETFNNAYTPTSSASGGSAPSGNSPYTGSSNSVITYNNTQQGYKDQMNANSIAWHDADETERKRLEQENQKLGAKLGGTVAYDPVTGLWSGNAERIATPEFTWSEARPTAPKTDPRIEELLSQILNRDAFSYNVADDPLYQQYAQMAQREGDRAMRETMAEAAAGAGGMNSYAVTAAQQAANYYNSQLNDRIPELHQLAYQMYLEDIDRQVRDLGLLQQMDATQYNRYRDTMSDWKDDRNFAYGMYQDDVAQNNWQSQFDFNAMIDNRDFNYKDYWANKEWDANQTQLDRENSRTDRKDAQDEILTIIESGGTPPAELVEQSGWNQATIDALILSEKEERQKSSTSSSGNGGSGGKSGSGGSSATYADYVTDLQNTCDEEWEEGGFSAVQKTLKEAIDSGNLDQNTYNRLYNYYRDKPMSANDFKLRGVMDLGLNMPAPSEEYILELAELGLVTISDDGLVKWAEGVNKDNYQVLLESQSRLPSLFNPTFTIK